MLSVLNQLFESYFFVAGMKTSPVHSKSTTSPPFADTAKGKTSDIPLREASHLHALHHKQRHHRLSGSPRHSTDEGQNYSSHCVNHSPLSTGGPSYKRYSPFTSERKSPSPTQHIGAEKLSAADDYRRMKSNCGSDRTTRIGYPDAQKEGFLSPQSPDVKPDGNELLARVVSLILYYLLIIKMINFNFVLVIGS